MSGEIYKSEYASLNCQEQIKKLCERLSEKDARIKELEEENKIRIDIDIQECKKIDALEIEKQKLKAELDEAKEVIMQYNDVIENSRGVAGLHLNGDIAEWDWLKEEWLSKNDTYISRHAQQGWK